jgi:hypothetical protein
VRWQRETNAASFQWQTEVRRQLALLRVTLWFCEREEEVSPSPNGGEMGRREHGSSSHLGEGMTLVARLNSRLEKQ